MLLKVFVFLAPIGLLCYLWVRHQNRILKDKEELRRLLGLPE
jgi:hypothetical protein